MRVSDTDILIVPGFGGSGEDHWQSRWEARLSTARRVHQENWDRPRLADWVERIAHEVEAATRPVIILAHSLGCNAVAHAAPQLNNRVRGAFLVAPASRGQIAALAPHVDEAFAHTPADPLPFPALVVASRTDSLNPYAEAEDFAYAWGAAMVDAGDAGHINTASGHGPWPEGLMRLASFLARL